MRSAVVCFAPQDACFAQSLGDFLQLNFALNLSNEETDDLVEGVERGLSDLTIVLLSPDSAAKIGTRDRWEPVFLDQPRAFDSQIAFVLARDCKFPELLRRRTFFDLRQDSVAGKRELKRWILQQESRLGQIADLPDEPLAGQLATDVLEDLQTRLADLPGCEPDLAAEAALAFAHACKGDFNGVFWIDCANRSQAGILGDVAQALGLRLGGTLEQNSEALRDFCAGRRCLFVFQNMAPVDRDIANFGGRTSVIFTSQGPVRPRRGFEEIAATFSSWTRDPKGCVQLLGDAASYLQADTALKLGEPIVSVLKYWGRFAEAAETLDSLAAYARDRGDWSALHRLKWEQSWILDRWNQPLPAPSPLPGLTQPSQLVLDLVAQAFLPVFMGAGSPTKGDEKVGLRHVAVSCI